MSRAGVRPSEADPMMALLNADERGDVCIVTSAKVFHRPEIELLAILVGGRLGAISLWFAPQSWRWCSGRGADRSGRGRCWRRPRAGSSCSGEGGAAPRRGAWPIDRLGEVAIGPVRRRLETWRVEGFGGDGPVFARDIRVADPSIVPAFVEQIVAVNPAVQVRPIAHRRRATAAEYVISVLLNVPAVLVVLSAFGMHHVTVMIGVAAVMFPLGWTWFRRRFETPRFGRPWRFALVAVSGAVAVWWVGALLAAAVRGDSTGDVVFWGALSLIAVVNLWSVDRYIRAEPLPTR